MTETRIFRIGLLPLFCLNVLLSRHDEGVQLSIAIYIYKFGFHMGLSVID